MSWLARLKSEKPQEHTLEKLGNPHPVGFLSSLASVPGGMQKNEGGFLGSLAPVPGTFQKFNASGTTSPSGPVDTATAANDPGDPHPGDDPTPQVDHSAPPDPDRYCWPHGPAMNGREIDNMAARLARFTDKGMSLDDAERLADRLVIRDREGDDRRLCLECAHLQGHGSWRCGNSGPADVAPLVLAPELVMMLQRCAGAALWRADGEHR